MSSGSTMPSPRRLRAEPTSRRPATACLRPTPAICRSRRPGCARLDCAGDFPEAAMDLVTWNIQWGKGCDGVVDLKRIVDTARKLSDADVFCLQEIAINFPLLDAGKGEDQPAVFTRLLPGYE